MQKRNSLKLDPSRLKVPFITIILVLLSDQLSKYLIRTWVGRFDHMAVIEGFFHIVHSRNTGVAFGFLSSLDPHLMNPILISVNLVIMCFLIWLTTMEDLPSRSRAGFGLILGGAAGNLVDRVFFGSVLDFLDFFVGGYHWPAFNIADAAISLGVILLIVDTLFGGIKTRKS